MDNQERSIEIPSFMKERMLEKQKERLEKQAERERYEIAKKNNAKKIKIRKAELKKKVVKFAFVGSASFVLGFLSSRAFMQIAGSEILANRTYAHFREYGITNGSNGYTAISNGKVIELDSVMYDGINDARYEGMTEAEIYVGLSKIYSDVLAKAYVGDIPVRDRVSAKYKAYHEEYELKNNRGVSR